MNEKDIDSFPTYIEAKESIQRLKDTKWPEFDPHKDVREYIGKIQEIIFSEFKTIPDFKRLIKPDKITFPFFRVRDFDSFTDIGIFSEHSYPPINVAGFGRCNFPNKPVFYCSNNPTTALAETIRNGEFQNKMFCISKWEILPSDEEIALQAFLNLELHEKNIFSALKEKELEEFEMVFGAKMGEDRIRGTIELIKFLHETFMDDDNYAISAVLSHRTLYGPHDKATDILIYPSKQTSLRGVNLAIHPNFVDNQMKVVRFYKVKVLESTSNHYDVKFLEYAYINKNVAMWKHIKKNDQVFLDYIQKDFEQIIKGEGKFSLESPE